MSISLILSGAGAVLAAIGSGVVLSRCFRAPRGDLICWSLALLGLLVSLGAQALGHLVGFDPAMFRAMEIGGQVIAPLALVLGLSEVAARSVPARFCARLYIPALAIVALVVLLLDQLAGVAFTKAWPDPSVYYQIAPEYALYAVGSITALIAIIAMVTVARRSNQSGWNAVLPGQLAGGVAALLLAYPALALLLEHEESVHLPVSSLFAALCAVAAGLTWLAGILTGRVPLAELRGRAGGRTGRPGAADAGYGSPAGQGGYRDGGLYRPDRDQSGTRDPRRAEGDGGAGWRDDRGARDWDDDRRSEDGQAAAGDDWRRVTGRPGGPDDVRQAAARPGGADDWRHADGRSGGPQDWRHADGPGDARDWQGDGAHYAAGYSEPDFATGDYATGDIVGGDHDRGDLDRGYHDRGDLDRSDHDHGYPAGGYPADGHRADGYPADGWQASGAGPDRGLPAGGLAAGGLAAGGLAAGGLADAGTAGADGRDTGGPKTSRRRAAPAEQAGHFGDEAERAQLFGQIAIYTLLEDRVEEFDQLAERVVDQVRSREPDALVYIVHAVPSAPMQRILYEVYRDREAYQRHILEPHVVQFETDRRPYVLATNVIELGLQQAKVSPFPSVAELFGEPGFDTSGFERPDYLRDYGRTPAPPGGQRERR